MNTARCLATTGYVSAFSSTLRSRVFGAPSTVIVRRCFPVCTFQSERFGAVVAAASVSPPWLNANDVTAPMPAIVRSSTPLTTSHKRTVPSHDPLASMVPSAVNATACTPAV